MVANALVTTRVNEHIKQEASEVLETMGLTVSDAVRLMLTKIAREKALPFDIWQPNEKTLAALREAESGKLKNLSLEEAKAEIGAILDEDD
ncbi:type II toxin-antitoxin system RelB/DinJ family antitoxin [Pelistega europaea]|uniref:Type II toxin-antitoxin system RelB/DinJ family antitoxin n=1 Tax=Pelistega europaea TaxID=106147 RepID=A0A7Y4L9B0_9BURK|nr:type II toxin-antitoxin system RelB/DinJ family antitoxin [Pelistega europaea]NOL49268.1 type II toxin-antitoxin system RelB/DinJ family antitoxin [Pelistega europaea]